MKIAISQKRLYMNQIDKNYALLENHVKQVKDSFDLIVFPELSLTGIIEGKRLVDETTIANYQEKIIKLSQYIPIIWGNYDSALTSKIYYAAEGKLIEYGDKKHPFRISFQNKTIVVSIDPVNTSALNIVLGLNKVFIDKQVEVLDNTIVVGTHGIYNNGQEVYLLNNRGYINYRNTFYAFVDELELLDTDRLSKKSFEDLSKLDLLIEAIRYFDEENLSYGPKWIVGVSGGLDSSVTVALLVMALGNERVHGVTMPSDFTRELTLKNANHLFEVLDISHDRVNIMEMVNATVNSLGHTSIEGLAYENIQARLRGHTLMSISSLINGVISNNGNKIETALGYATLYGDAIGALSLLGDINKLEVGELASEINDRMGEEIIPQNLIPDVKNHEIIWEFAPSAELSKDQFDPMKWGYHDLLVEYLMQNSIESYLEDYLNGTLFNTKLGQYLKAYKLSPEEFIHDLEWVYRQLGIATYKRVQIPPVIKLYSYGFFPEAQVPIVYSNRYKQLKNKVLKKES